MEKNKTGGRKSPTKQDPVKQVLQKLGDRLGLERRVKGMTFEALAEKSGVSTLSLSSLEKGKLDNLSLTTMFKIANALGLEISIEVKE